MPKQVRDRSRPQRPAKTPSRTAAFREAARAIVAKDRYDRRVGLSVDTAGAIARALERAYMQGFADAQAPAPSSPALSGDGNAGYEGNAPVEWILIPPRPRNAFWTICLFTIGRDPAVMPAGHLQPMVLPSGRPGWQLITGHGRDKPFRQPTLLPLLRLGLLGLVHESDQRLVVTARGLTTWRRFLERGGQFPEDLTEPA